MINHPNTQIQRRVFVSGRVQGVGFRASVVREANRLPGLRGYVRNLSDGRVEAVFLGETEAVETLVEWCGRGPFGASISSVEVRDEELDDRLPPFGIVR